MFQQRTWQIAQRPRLLAAWKEEKRLTRKNPTGSLSSVPQQELRYVTAMSAVAPTCNWGGSRANTGNSIFLMRFCSFAGLPMLTCGKSSLRAC